VSTGNTLGTCPVAGFYSLGSPSDVESLFPSIGQNGILLLLLEKALTMAALGTPALGRNKQGIQRLLSQNAYWKILS
jgi:hypothetical protein